MWKPGQVILDEYEVLRELGVGGAGATFQVRQIDRGSLLAVKVPHRHLFQSAEDRIQLANEVQLWIALPDHPHVVQCYFVREIDGTPVIFAEYVPSGTLGSWRARGRIHGLAHGLDLGIQLAEAMRIAQQTGIVHRDIKPSNCLMDSSGHLKLGDFGIALAQRRARQRDDATSSAGRAYVGAGSLFYCSPEQFDGLPVGSPTDVWSFGVTLFEVLTGKTPGCGPAARFLVENYAAPPDEPPIPRAVLGFVLSLVELDPARRPSSFAEISRHIQLLYKQVTGRTYSRTFPDAQAVHRPPPTVHRPPGLAARAILAKALGRAGRDPAEAEKLSVTALEGRRAGTAEALAELTLLAEAARIYRGMLAQPDAGQVRRELAGVLHRIAQLQKDTGDLGAAVAAYDEAISHVKQAQQVGRDETLLVAFAEAVLNRAVCHRQLGEPTRAIAGYDEGIALLRAVRKGPLLPVACFHLATLYQNRSMALLKVQRPRHALRDIDQAIQIIERLTEKSASNRNLLDLAGKYLDRGIVHRNCGNAADALGDYGRAIEIYRDRLSHFPSAKKDEQLAMAYIDRGAAYVASGQPRLAVGDAEQAIAILEQLTRREDAANLLSALSMAYNNRALARRHSADLRGAIEDMDRSIELRERVAKRGGLETIGHGLARAYSNKALFLMDAGDLGYAGQVAERGVAWLTSMVDRKGRKDLRLDLANMRKLRGILHCRRGEEARGIEELAEGIRTFEKLLDTRSIDVIRGFLETLAAYLETCTRKPSEADRVAVATGALRRLRAVSASGRHLPPGVEAELQRLRYKVAPIARQRTGHARFAELETILEELIRGLRRRALDE